MTPTRCKPNQLAIVEHNRSGLSCFAGLQGMPVVTQAVEYVHPVLGPVWRVGQAVPCARCGGAVRNFLDADLRPIEPPAVDGATITELVVDVPEVEQS